MTSEDATALFHLRCLWQSAYAISVTDGIWVARRRDNPTPLRGRIRCRVCQRRMCGTTRTSPRYWAEGPDYNYINVYYQCTLDVTHPGKAAAYPDHPRTISVRQDLLVDLIRDFFTHRVFGPDRAALLAEQIPATTAQAAQQRDRQRDRLARELARIDLAQRSQIIQIETLPPDPANTAAQAMRARCYERFAELQADRETIQAQLDDLDRDQAPVQDASLLDTLPLLADTTDLHPEAIQAALYQAFDIQALYNTDMHQVTIFATITTSTPQAVAAILADTGHDPTTQPAASPAPPRPSPLAIGAPVYPLAERPYMRVSSHDHGSRPNERSLCIPLPKHALQSYLCIYG
jgi:hypothetical protein